MKCNVLGCLAATLLGSAIVGASPAMAFHGGGGFGGGGMHFGGGGMHVGGVRGGGFGRFHGGSFGPRFTGRSVAIGRFDRDDRFFFRHHRRFRNFAFFGAPFFGFGAWPYYYDYAAYYGCWRQAWTGYGYRWTNVCYDYGYNYGY